jgi:meso-butanediol dehydrogenase / (S,S)-butanediol dehydrogenase / diacetyl reductase
MEESMSSLTGKVAFVTGAAVRRGMGRGVVLRLAGEGADIVAVDRYATPTSVFSEDASWGGLNSVVAEVEAMGCKGLAVEADISNRKEVDAAVAKAIAKFGKIDILVHCAAIRGPIGIPVAKLSEADWRAVLDVNLTGSFFVSSAIADKMVEKGEGGKIVLISSLAGNHGVPGNAAYSASKWGVIGLGKSLALELAKNGINVNVINPGTFDTALRDTNYERMAKAEGISVEDFRKRFDANMGIKVPIGRMGIPLDIANLCLFLVTDQSSYLTAQAIDIDGGWGQLHG